MDNRARFSEDDGKNVGLRNTSLSKKIFNQPTKSLLSSGFNEDFSCRSYNNNNLQNPTQKYEATIAEANRILKESGNFISDRRHTTHLVSTDYQKKDEVCHQGEGDYNGYVKEDKDRVIQGLLAKIEDKNSVICEFQEVESNYIHQMNLLQRGDCEKASLVDRIHDLECTIKSLHESKNIYQMEAEKLCISEKDAYMFKSKSDGLENQLDFFKNENKYMHNQLVMKAEEMGSKDMCIQELEIQNEKIIEEYSIIVNKMKREIEGLNFNLQEERMKNQE